MAITKALGKVASYTNVLSPRGAEEEILKTALEHEITAYDASYIVLAKKNDLTLVTEDKKLRAKAERLVKAKSRFSLDAHSNRFMCFHGRV